MNSVSRRRRVRPAVVAATPIPPAVCYCVLLNLLLSRQTHSFVLRQPIPTSTHVVHVSYPQAPYASGHTQDSSAGARWSSSSLLVLGSTAKVEGQAEDEQEEIGVPDTLRDVVVEQIQELGGGKVIQVGSPILSVAQSTKYSRGLIFRKTEQNVTSCHPVAHCGDEGPQTQRHGLVDCASYLIWQKISARCNADSEM